jgi:hypothetical protein
VSSRATPSEQCYEIDDDLPDLALGTLSGRRRAEVLGHVGSCARCSSELQALSTISDLLLLLAPAAEPPVGFELRLADKLRAGASPPPARRLLQRIGSLAAAAAVVAVLGAGVGIWASAGHRSAPDQTAAADLASAQLQHNGSAVGQVMISAGRPAWMFVTVYDLESTGNVRCAITLADGAVDTVGVFKLSSGYGAWGTALPAGQVRSVRLVSSAGVTLASARISA